MGVTALMHVHRVTNTPCVSAAQHRNLLSKSHTRKHTRMRGFSTETSKGLAEGFSRILLPVRMKLSAAEPVCSELHQPRHDGDGDTLKCGFGATRQDACFVGPAFLHPRVDKRKSHRLVSKSFFMHNSVSEI